MADLADDDDRAEDSGHELRTLRLVQDMSGGSTIVVDADLAIVSATGPDLVRNGFDPAELAGQRLDLLLADQDAPKVLAAYRRALGGQEARMEFVDETSGRLFDLEVRPLHGADGVVVGAVARASDLSDARAQQTHLAHVAAVQGLGVSTYGVHPGWRHDARALALLGIDDPGLDAESFIASVVLRDDQPEARSRWEQLVAQGGRAVLSYRVADTAGGDSIRRIQTTIEAHLGSGGRLLRVVATHVDVTAAAEASAALERSERKAQADRVGLVRDLSAMIAQSPLSVGEIAKTVTDLAVAALGGGAFFAELSEGPTDPSGELSTGAAAFGRVAISHAEPTGASELVSSWEDPLTRPTPQDEALRAVLTTGEPWVRTAGRARRRTGPQGSRHAARHVLAVPVRAHAQVVGVLGLERPATDPPYATGDLDLAQIMADHIGSALVSELALTGERRQRARVEAANLLLTDARNERHSLVELLSETETRERMLLAEAVHDEPIQLIAAARLRLMALVRRLAREGEDVEPVWQRTVTDEGERVGAILETAMNRLRLLIVALTPPDLGDGLLHAVGEVAEATFRGTGTTVQCFGPAALELTAGQQDAAMRILREALVNSRQHARASRVVVRAVVDGGQTVLSVEDDGVGSSQVGPRKGHLGMVSMRARAVDAGAELTVSSAPGAGTTVVLRFPPPRRP